MATTPGPLPNYDNSKEATSPTREVDGLTFRIERVQKWTLWTIVSAALGFGVWIGTLTNKIDNIESFAARAEDPSGGIIVRLTTLQADVEHLQKTEGQANTTKPAQTSDSNQGSGNKDNSVQTAGVPDSERLRADLAVLQALTTASQKLSDESAQAATRGNNGQTIPAELTIHVAKDQEPILQELAAALKQLPPAPPSGAAADPGKDTGHGSTDVQDLYVRLEIKQITAQQLEDLERDVSNTKMKEDVRVRVKSLISLIKEQLNTTTLKP